MKKNYALLNGFSNRTILIFRLILIVTLTYTQARAQQFSADNATDWDIFPVGNLVVTEVDDTEATDGTSLEITTAVSTDNWFDALAQTFQNNTPATVNGNFYSVSFRHRASSDRQIRVQVHGRPTDTFGSDDNTYYDEFVDVTQDYKEIRIEFTSTDVVAGTVHVQFYAGADDTPVYIDDFTITSSIANDLGTDETYATVGDWDNFPIGNLLISEEEDAEARNDSSIKFTTAVSTDTWFNTLAQTFQDNTPPTVNGDGYTVSLRVKADAGRQLRLQVHGRPTDTFGPDDNTYYDEFINISADYQDFDIEFVSNDTVPGSIHVQLFAGGDDTAFYVDDVVIENTGPVSIEGTEPFEDSTKWNSYAEGDLNEEIVTDENAVNGEAFRVSPQTTIADKEWFDTGFQILQDAAVREEAGKTYKISFRYRAEADRQFRLSLLSRPLDTFGSDDTDYFGGFLQATTEYQEFTIEATSSASLPSAIYIGFLVGGSDTALLIDDIQIEEIIPTREPTTLYVSKDGDNSNSGTENSPEGAWQTIAYALSQLVAGDVLLLNDGLYQENSLVLKDINGDAATKTIVKSINKWGAKIEGTTQFETIFQVENSSYIEIDGIEVFNNNNVDFEDWNAGVQIFGADHVTVKNVFAHDCGCNGISAREGDYFTIENNIVRDNAKTNPFNCSGISVYQPINLDDEPGFHIIVRNNVAFENECRLPFTPLGFDVPTDGNGIIFDDFNQTQSEGVAPYTAASLIENNLTFNNGGAGIKIFEVSNTTVRNNTAWHNNYVLQEFSSGIGEIGLEAISGPITVSNNLVVKTFQQPGHGLSLQTAANGSATYTNNIVVGSTSFDTSATVLEGNLVVSDNQQSFPKFANATTDVEFTDIASFKVYFGVREGSPALDAANPDLAPEIDLDGVSRPVDSTADIGAYEGAQDGTAPLPIDNTLIAEVNDTQVAINIDGIKDGAYIGSQNTITKKSDGNTIIDENDLSAIWTSLYDDEYLYVLVDVKDDDLQNDSDAVENDDSIELYLDGGNSRDSIFGSDDFIYRIGWNDSDSLTELTKNDIEGVEAAVSDSDGGYIAEFAIPWNKLGATPADSLRIGIDVHINEDDEGGPRNSKLVWQDVLEDLSTVPMRFGNAFLKETAPTPAIQQLSEAITIDGVQDTFWQDVTSLNIANTFSEEVTDSLDLSASWKSVWDEENLYFLISVNDDDLQNDSDQWFEDDGVEIYIDADNSKNTSYGDNDYQITIGWNDDDIVEDTKNNLGPGSTAKVIDTDNGYDVEVSIPWSALAIEPADGDFLGLDVHVNDDDEGGSRSGKAAWFATADESFRDPSTFGNVFLEGDMQVPPDMVGTVFGEFGNSSATDEWEKVKYSNVYEDPIVVMGPIGTEGGQPATVTVRNIGGSRFQWRVDEWEYLDGIHNRESAGYMVVESGAYILENGKKIIAEKTRVTAAWKKIRFSDAFSEIPVVIPQIINLKAKQALDVRVRNVTKKGFEMLVQPEEGKRRNVGSFRELVGYIAIEPGAGQISDVGAYEVAKPSNDITQTNSKVLFGQTFSDNNRVFLGHEQTTNGIDPGTVRYRTGSLNATGATLFFQEEKSKDNEIAHKAEKFGLAIFTKPGNLLGSASNLKDVDTNEENKAVSFEIKLYPNPATNSISLTLSNIEYTKNAEVVIYNIFGHEALRKIQKNLGDTIDISELNRGMYIVELKLNGKLLRKLMMKK